MEAKAAVRALLDQLPDDCTLDDIQYHVYVLRAVQRGLADVAAGRTIPHEQVERELKERWLFSAGE